MKKYSKAYRAFLTAVIVLSAVGIAALIIAPFNRGILNFSSELSVSSCFLIDMNIDIKDGMTDDILSFVSQKANRLKCSVAKAGPAQIFLQIQNADWKNAKYIIESMKSQYYLDDQNIKYQRITVSPGFKTAAVSYICLLASAFAFLLYVFLRYKGKFLRCAAVWSAGSVIMPVGVCALTRLPVSYNTVFAMFVLFLVCSMCCLIIFRSVHDGFSSPLSKYGIDYVVKKNKRIYLPALISVIAFFLIMSIILVIVLVM